MHAFLWETLLSSLICRLAAEDSKALGAGSTWVSASYMSRKDTCHLGNTALDYYIEQEITFYCVKPDSFAAAASNPLMNNSSSRGWGHLDNQNWGAPGAGYWEETSGAETHPHYNSLITYDA